MTFGRLVWWVTPEAERRFQTLWVPARWITLVFVSFDLGSYVVLLIDAVIYAISPSQKKHERSRGVIIQRLETSFQLLGLALFTIFAIRFMFVSKRWRRQWPVGGRRNWMYLGWATVASSALMTVGFCCLLSILFLPRCCDVANIEADLHAISNHSCFRGLAKAQPPENSRVAIFSLPRLANVGYVRFCLCSHVHMF